MKVLLLANEAPKEFARRNAPETLKPYMAEWYAFSEAMSKAGVTQSGAALEQPSTATVVSVRDGKRTVQDGATEWAKKCPAAKEGFIDIRPVPYLEEGEE